MKPSPVIVKTKILMLALMCVASVGAHAQSAPSFPAKPIRLVVPYPPGGGTDTIGRPLAHRLTENLKQQVIVDNRGGAGGNIGMELVAKSPPDGYTLVLALTAQLAVNPSLYKKLPYDPIRDFEPVSLLATGPYILVVHPSLPAKSVKELIALARARPGQLGYASSGNGSGGHLAAALLESMANVKMLHVPYKGGGPALVDLLAGNVQVLFATYATSKPHIDSGRVRPLGVSTARRLSGVDIPTIAETGLPGYDAGVWYAVLAPAGTPREIVARLNAEIVRALRAPEVKALLEKANIETVGSTPEELTKFMKSEIAKWAGVVKAANVQID
jgi:tripartite-type tricarboxylate transporter receptor subunit TctC